MLTARQEQYETSSQTDRTARKEIRTSNEQVLSDKFIESFHVAAMEAAEEIKKGKKPRFVKVA